MARQYQKSNGRQLADFVILLVLAGLVCVYCLDAIRASTHILNLIFVVPITTIVLVLCLVEFFVGAPNKFTTEPVSETVTQILPVVGLFTGYVVSLQWLGFDVGTFVFLAAFLFLHGERRLAWLLGYSISIAWLLSVSFSKLLPYPMPLLILSPAY
jgi:hypothetical protein